MDISAKAVPPMLGGCSSVSRKDSTHSTSVKVKLACEKRFRRTRKLSRKRRRLRRKSDKKNREIRNMAPETVEAFDSYWQNYYRCLKWTQNHYVSFWKSRVQALEYENRMLRSLIDQNKATQKSVPSSLHSSYCDKSREGPGTFGKQNVDCEHLGTNFDPETACSKNIMTCDNETEDYEEVCDDNSEEFEFEVDSNMIEFFTQSMKHKLALHQERSAEEGRGRDSSDPVNWKKIRNVPREQHFSKEDKSRSETCVNKKKMYLSQCQQDQKIEATELHDILLRKAEQEEREKHKVDLYGKSAPKIMGMETAMQLNFRQVCLSKRPTPWPVIPLNL